MVSDEDMENNFMLVILWNLSVISQLIFYLFIYLFIYLFLVQNLKIT